MDLADKLQSIEAIEDHFRTIAKDCSEMMDNLEDAPVLEDALNVIMLGVIDVLNFFDTARNDLFKEAGAVTIGIGKPKLTLIKG